MPPSDADARVLEQFLKTMAPPAGLTAVYRQRVVRASLAARTKVLQRRQRQIVLAACLCAGLLFTIPAVALTVSIRAVFAPDGPAWLAADTSTVPLENARMAVDEFESSAMDAQWLSRLQNLLVTQRPAKP